MKIFKWISAIFFIAYPFIVGWSLAHGHLYVVSFLLIGLGIIRFLTKSSLLLTPLTMFAVLCGSLSLILNDLAWLKLYPVLMSLGAFFIFGLTLLKPPSMIERFARIMQPDLPESGVVWTRNVTKVWCGFFLINAAIAWCSVVYFPTHFWVIYNGFISYLLMGCLFGGEYLLRKRYQRLHQNESIS